MFPLVITRFTSVTGGTQGKRVPRFRAPGWTGLTDDQWKYYVLLAFAVVAFALVRNLVKSRVGRALIATRDNETAAAGARGAPGLLQGAHLRRQRHAGRRRRLPLGVQPEPFVNASKYDITLSITLLVAVVVGGAATIFGPAWGAFFVVMIPVWLPTKYPQLSPVFFGGALILLMIVAPGGFLGLVRQVAAWLRRQIRRPAANDPPRAATPRGGSVSVGP